MNEIVEHVPNFVDTGDEPRRRAEFSTLEELERVPFVERWKTGKDFVRFSKSDNCLMAELSTPPIGEFWVVGFLSDPTAVDLPQWVESDAHRLRREAWNRGERI